MKKTLSVFIVGVLICLLFGCDLDTDTGNVRQIVGESEYTQKTDESEFAFTTEKNETKDIPEECSINEQLCFEYAGVKVTAKEIVKDSIRGMGIKLLIENNSDKDYSVRVEEVTVNNCMVSSLFSSPVAAGKKANDTLYFSSASMKNAGIKNIGQIEIYFYLYDSSTYSRVYTAECTTIKTSLFDKTDMNGDDSGHELYNTDGIRIIGKYVDEDTIWGSSVLLYIENKTTQNITVSCESMSVNGFMVTGLMSSTVYKGKYAVDDIDILSSSLEENGIKSIETISLKFHIYNADTYSTIKNTDEISFNVK